MNDRDFDALLSAHYDKLSPRTLSWLSTVVSGFVAGFAVLVLVVALSSAVPAQPQNVLLGTSSIVAAEEVER